MNETDIRLERCKSATRSQRALWLGQSVEGYVHPDCSYHDYRVAIGLLCGGQVTVVPVKRTWLERLLAAWREYRATRKIIPYEPV